DGIRDGHVTGVQTCALPIFIRLGVFSAERNRSRLCRCYHKKSAMATAANPAAPAWPAERFFRASLSLLVLSSILTLASTDKLDGFTSLFAPLAALYKGYRWWHG